MQLYTDTFHQDDRTASVTFFLFITTPHGQLHAVFKRTVMVRTTNLLTYAVAVPPLHPDCHPHRGCHQTLCPCPLLHSVTNSQPHQSHQNHPRSETGCCCDWGLLRGVVAERLHQAWSFCCRLLIWPAETAE